MENLQHLRYYFEDEKEIDTFVATDDTLGGPEQKIQIARMRRARAAVRQNERRNENHSTTPSAAEWDDLAEEGTLSDIKLQFWKRYRTKHPVEITPFRPFAVLLLQRTRETPPSVYDIWEVRTLHHQVMPPGSRRKPTSISTHSRTRQRRLQEPMTWTATGQCCTHSSCPWQSPV